MKTLAPGWQLLFLCSILARAVLAQAPTAPDTVDKDYAAELPRIEPLSPANALNSFEIVPGFKLEQVAAEPLVADPIAICFDENSRMFVVEMRGYSENREEKISRIKLLEDTDEDGKFDKATTFADQLNWPTAIHCWKGGVFVADAPDLLYLKDTTGDGVADEKKVVLTGFGTSNVQGLVNTFQWSLDNKITMAISSSGAELRKPAENFPEAVISLRGRDLSLDPETLRMRPLTGGAQHGATTDIWGNRFVCSNSDHIQHCVFEDGNLAQNPLVAVARARRSIAVDGPQADVFRISPLEPWRIVRTRLRVNKIVPGIVEGGGRASGYFTSATGVTIYSGDAWPAEFLGTAFVGDVGSNIVHRKKLTPDGVSFKAERIDEKKEFIASRDTWFRPVQFANAPDGCLYICDMYRETIEHPLSIPPILKKHLDLTSGRDRGRIYRVRHETSQQRRLPKFGKASTAELVAALEHANSWHRETAVRLLHEQQDPAAVPLLEKLVLKSKRPETRLVALCSLAVRKQVSIDVQLAAMRDDHPAVRARSVRTAQLHLTSQGEEQRDGITVPLPLPSRHEEVELQLTKMARDESLTVRFQVALSLWMVDSQPRESAPWGAVVRDLLQRDLKNDDCRLAIQLAATYSAGPLLEVIAAEEKFIGAPEGKELAFKLLKQADRLDSLGDYEPLTRVLGKWLREKSPLLDQALPHLKYALRRDTSLGKHLNHELKGELRKRYGANNEAAVRVALDPQAALPQRLSALKQISLAPDNTGRDVAEQLLSPKESREIQSAAIALLDNNHADGIEEMLLDKLSILSPAIKEQAIDLLLAEQKGARLLLLAIGDKRLAAGELGAARWNALLASRQSEIALMARSLYQLSDRANVLTEYRPVLAAAGDKDRGKEVFKKNCAACHKLQGVGHELGPNLAAMKARGPEAVLVNVLDPNREVNPQYLNYLLLTTDGRSFSGILSAETATSVTLRKQDNVSETVLRVDIESLKSTGQSLMPVGMEKQIDRTAMADLLEYLKTVE